MTTNNHVAASPSTASPVMVNPAVADLVLRVVMPQYDKGKDEQIDRIGRRDHHVYLFGGSIVGVILGAATLKHAGILLVLPVVAFVLGWIYLTNDDKVSDLGAFIRSELIPAVRPFVPAGTPVFGWETYPDPRRRLRKVVQLFVDLLTFCLPGAAAIAGFWLIGPRPVILVVVSIVELLMVVGQAALFVLYADVAKRATAHCGTREVSS